VNGRSTKFIGWSLAAVIFGLNAYLVFATFFPHLVPGAAAP
jgi:Mn2+/Fe2+ NRAMP family transporter